jgi:hypothetical protein
MKTITMYELLGMIKDGKAPKKFKMSECIYTLNDITSLYYDEEGEELFDSVNICKCLDEPVEILEEEINEYKNIFLEAWKPISKQFRKLFDELLRIKNDLGLNLEDEIEEEKKIPEKLNNQHFHKKQRQLANKINEIIDYFEYLKSKGDE